MAVVDGKWTGKFKPSVFLAAGSTLGRFVNTMQVVFVNRFVPPGTVAVRLAVWVPAQE